MSSRAIKVGIDDGGALQHFDGFVDGTLRISSAMPDWSGKVGVPTTIKVGATGPAGATYKFKITLDDALDHQEIEFSLDGDGNGSFTLVV